MSKTAAGPTHERPLEDKIDLRGRQEPITVPQPRYDPYFTANEKVIQDLLNDEKKYHATPAFCAHEPEGRAKWMRRALLNWLRDVCEHSKADTEVLSHTAQLVDRYMHKQLTDKREYQLVGAACFFISSKLKETVPVPIDRMVQYTDYSVSKQDILAKELTICIKLEWDLSGITPIDFISPVVDFLRFVDDLRYAVRKSAIGVYIKIYHVEQLNFYPPSYIAAACIFYALQLTIHPDLSDLAMCSVTRVQQLLGLEARKIREVYQVVLSCFEPGTVQLSQTVIQVDSAPPATPARPAPVTLPTIATTSASNSSVYVCTTTPISTSCPIAQSGSNSNITSATGLVGPGLQSQAMSAVAAAAVAAVSMATVGLGGLIHSTVSQPLATSTQLGGHSHQLRSHAYSYQPQPQQQMQQNNHFHAAKHHEAEALLVSHDRLGERYSALTCPTPSICHCSTFDPHTQLKTSNIDCDTSCTRVSSGISQGSQASICTSDRNRSSIAVLTTGLMLATSNIISSTSNSNNSSSGFVTGTLGSSDAYSLSSGNSIACRSSGTRVDGLENTPAVAVSNLSCYHNNQQADGNSLVGACCNHSSSSLAVPTVNSLSDSPDPQLAQSVVSQRMASLRHVHHRFSSTGLSGPSDAVSNRPRSRRD